jgi:hypothetical protein
MYRGDTLIDFTLNVAGIFSISIRLKEIYWGFGASLAYSKLCAAESTRLGPIKKPLPLAGF